jgi:hypothetical protein
MFRKKVFLWGLLLLCVGLVSCTQRNQQSSDAPTAIPTWTGLPPFITETPRVTATLTPSETPTPSDTPTPTDTATPVSPTPTTTLTPTPPVLGRVIITDFNVNVRSSAERLPDNAIATVEPGTTVETHGASQDQQWIYVRYIDPEGQLIEGWIQANLLEFDDDEFVPPTIGPSPTPSTAAAQGGTPGAFVTATPAGSVTPVAQGTPGERLSDVNILAYCRTENVTPARPRVDQTVSIFWSWYAARPELMEDHLQNMNYEVLLDGRLLENYGQFQTEMRRESDGNWYVYWYVPVGALAAGRHEVTYRVTWDAEISDGYARFGPGTSRVEEVGNCVFTVAEGS